MTGPEQVTNGHSNRPSIQMHARPSRESLWQGTLTGALQVGQSPHTKALRFVKTKVLCPLFQRWLNPMFSQETAGLDFQLDYE